MFAGTATAKPGSIFTRRAPQLATAPPPREAVQAVLDFYAYPSKSLCCTKSLDGVAAIAVTVEIGMRTTRK